MNLYHTRPIRGTVCIASFVTDMGCGNVQFFPAIWGSWIVPVWYVLDTDILVPLLQTSMSAYFTNSVRKEHEHYEAVV